VKIRKRTLISLKTVRVSDYVGLSRAGYILSINLLSCLGTDVCETDTRCSVVYIQTETSVSGPCGQK
jgi:hypothetical protein